MSDLGYINGVIKSKSTELLDLKQVEQLNNLSKDMLNSTLQSMQIFKKELTNDEAFMKDEIELKAFLMTLYPANHLIFQLFYLSDDHRVLANVIKEKHLKLEVETYSPLANLKKEVVETALQDDKTLSTLFQSLNGKSSKEISDATFKYLHAEIGSKVKKAHDKALSLYFKKYTDKENIMLYMRARVFKLSLDTFYPYFLEGGEISLEFFKELDKLDLKDAYLELRKFYKVEAFKSQGKLGSHDFLALLNIDLEQDLLDIIESLTYNLDGYSPSIEYILRRRHIMQSIKEIYYKKEREVNV